MADTKTMTPFRKGMTTDEITQRMSKAAWHINAGGQYVHEKQIIREEIPV